MKYSMKCQKFNFMPYYTVNQFIVPKYEVWSIFFVCDEDCNRYMSTKFFRTLVGIRKQDQGAGRDVYKFVPLQDFTL